MVFQSFPPFFLQYHLMKMHNNPLVAVHFCFLRSVRIVTISGQRIFPVDELIFTHNFKRFNLNPRKIACYYGIVPFGRDSGTSVHSAPHVHYMVNRMLKAMLTQAALASIRFCPLVKDYYNRLVNRGKKKQVALNNVKNKLIHIVTAMVKNNQPFNPEYINIHKTANR